MKKTDKVKVKLTKEAQERKYNTCSHTSRKSKRWERSAFQQLSTDDEGRSIMRCAKCGLDKVVTVNAIYLSDRQRQGRRPDPRTRPMHSTGHVNVVPPRA